MELFILVQNPTGSTPVSRSENFDSHGMYLTVNIQRIQWFMYFFE
jgi:hypothetical protein